LKRRNNDFRPVELKDVERMSPPLNLKLPVCVCLGLAKIPILVQAKLAQTLPEKGGGYLQISVANCVIET
jgi:hypothetical protein